VKYKKARLKATMNQERNTNYEDRIKVLIFT